MEQISEFTKLNWHQISNLPVVEFLNYMSYNKDKILKNNDEAKKLANKYKSKRSK